MIILHCSPPLSLSLSVPFKRRPGNLRIIWLRSHRRVQSSDVSARQLKLYFDCPPQVEFVVTEDRGPNGADGRAVFDPPINASLIVTLYRVSPRLNELGQVCDVKLHL